MGGGYREGGERKSITHSVSELSERTVKAVGWFKAKCILKDRIPFLAAKTKAKDNYRNNYKR